MSQKANPQTENKAGRLAFAYCKIATFSLLAGRFALPLAALLSASFFIVSYTQGKKDTKCYLQYPLVAAGLWIVVLGLWVVGHIFQSFVPSWIRWMYP